MNTNSKIQKITFLIIFLVVLTGLTYYLYFDLKGGGDIQETKKEKSEISSIEEQIRSSISANGDFDIEIIPVNQQVEQVERSKINISVPDLDGEIIFSDTYPQEAREISRNNIDKLRTQLKADNTLYEQWINLGLQYKIAGDYMGAKDAWEYAGAIRPKNSVSFHNLGDLYGYFLKDIVKAEQNFIKAVENSPNNIMYYFKLAEFYRDIEKNIEKARSVIEQGIEKNPNSTELKLLLDSL